MNGNGRPRSSCNLATDQSSLDSSKFPGTPLNKAHSFEWNINTFKPEHADIRIMIHIHLLSFSLLQSTTATCSGIDSSYVSVDIDWWRSLDDIVRPASKFEISFEIHRQEFFWSIDFLVCGCHYYDLIQIWFWYFWRFSDLIFFSTNRNLQYFRDTYWFQNIHSELNYFV